jgi:acetyl-CoA carboxylase biotin carboxyl carrier protein
VGSFFELEQIASILEMLERHDVSEFKLERGDEKLALRRGQEQVTQVISAPQFGHGHYPGAQYPGQFAQSQQYSQAPQTSPPPLAQGHLVSNSAPSDSAAVSPRVEHANGTDHAAAKPAGNFKEVRSPMVGTFYRRPAVDAEPYVSVGDSVKKGDVLCIVEAMKLMNEIETDVAGKIVEVRLEDGQMVEYGEVLFRIEPI